MPLFIMAIAQVRQQSIRNRARALPAWCFSWGAAMGLLTDVIGGVLREKGGSSGMEGALQNLLGGSQKDQAQPSQFGSFGGLAGLVAAFERAGLGPIIQSWIGQGPNQPVSPDQLQNTLGQDRVRAMSQSAGMSSQSFLSELSQHLPEAVDRATPDGKHPDDGTVSV